MARPVLSTQRLRLEPLTEVHLEHLVALDADADVMRFLTGRPRTRAEVVALHPLRTDPQLDAAGLGYWAGFLCATGEFVGWWLLVPPDDPYKGRTGDGVLGYRLARAFWRQGLATEGSRAVLHYGFTALALPRVTADTMAVNTGSRGVMRALGMTHVRTVHVEFDDPLPGIEEGEVVYEITRDQWLRQELQQQA